MKNFLSALLLSAALITPASLGFAQDHDRDDQNREHRTQRYYDRQGRDWHEWNDNENRAYNRYWQDQHRDQREWSKMNKRQQQEYWRWRHTHPDADGDRR